MSEIKKTRYSPEELVEFEELILNKLSKAKQELDYIKKYLAKSEETSEGSTLVNVKTLEAGAATAEKENLSQLALRQKKFIKQLEDALVRIKNGTYGICEESGNLIRKERLRIVPHTRLSIDSKKKQINWLDYLIRHIEALIFCAKQPIAIEELKQCLSEMFDADVPEDDIQQAIEALQNKYNSERYAFEPVMSGGGFQFLTKPAYQSSISVLLKQQSKKRLSSSALETLAIIAYSQPVTKSEIERIRGVNSDYSVQKLLEKELIVIQGKSEAIGRPLIYGTSDSFMDYFGINDLSELPTLKDIQPEQNEIGQEAE